MQPQKIFSHIGPSLTRKYPNDSYHKYNSTYNLFFIKLVCSFCFRVGILKNDKIAHRHNKKMRFVRSVNFEITWFMIKLLLFVTILKKRYIVFYQKLTYASICPWDVLTSLKLLVPIHFFHSLTNIQSFNPLALRAFSSFFRLYYLLSKFIIPLQFFVELNHLSHKLVKRRKFLVFHVIKSWQPLIPKL